MAQDSFHVWLARPRVWPKKIRGRDGTERHDFSVAPDWFVQEGDRKARKVAGPFTEPAEASDVAEMLLSNFGVQDQSWAELRYNGDREPHTMIFLLEDGVFGVWNTASARWPIFYPVNEYGVMLEGWPDGMEPGAEDEIEGESEGESDGFGKADEDSKLMDLSNDGSDDDAEDEGAEEDDEAEDEAWEEDDEAEDEIEDEDGELDDDAEDEMSDESADEIPDEEDDEGEEEGEDEDESDDESDEEDEEESDDDSENEDEEEAEMPRLNIFAKMRGPKGWRKRADAEDLLERNVFGFKVGVLDPDEEKTNAQRERELVAHVEFIEDDSMRTAGVLRMKLPTVDVDEIEWKRRGQFIEAVIPYRGEEK